jgi:two-component system sensor histidine kinase YesM
MSGKKILAAITKNNVQKQLSIIFFIAIFIPVISIGYYLVYNTRSLLFNHYEDQSRSDDLRVKSLLLDLTSNIYIKAESLSSDKELIQLLSTVYTSPAEGTRAMENYKGFETLLSQDIAIQRISVYTRNNSLPESKYIHQITPDLQKNDWFEQAYTTVTPFWTEEVVSDDFGNDSLMLCLHTRIFLPQINSFAILNLTVSNNHIKNRIENSSLNTVLWLNEDEIFYCSNKQTIDNSLKAYATGPNGYYLGKINLPEQNVIGCVSSLSTTYWNDLFYVASLNYDGYPYMNKITGLYLGILLLILIATSAFIYTYSRYFSRRVITLRETMHNASQGNYNIIDTFHGEDEISEAFADLNAMIQDILRKEASVYEAQIRTQQLTNQQQQMEFKMLTSQINPHFLYNTLETIRMRSLKAGNLDVANAVKLLGKSMRYVLENTTTSFITLARELDYIDTYLSIQKLRFHDSINYSLKTSPQMDLNEYQIMPLLLQPIVENGVLHGLREMEQGGKIIIHIIKKGDKLYIDIFDNGSGMTPEEIDAMNKSIYKHHRESSKRIGLYNIYQRIQLYYGKSFGFQIKSKKHWGTLVTMVLPAKEYRRGMEE